MVSLKVYGIKNCDTMKKAFAWLDQHGVAYDFHDYKKLEADPALLEKAIKQFGWENVLNRKGTSWRGLPDNVRDKMDAKSALQAALDNPSLIRRPLIVQGDEILFGFDAAEYQKRFG